MSSPEELRLDERRRRGLAARVGTTLEGDRDGRGLRIGLACSRFNGGITARLAEGALGALGALGVDGEDVVLGWVPGAFELPLLARTMVASGLDAVVCLGAVFRGETGHYELVAGGCASGIQRVQLDTGVPVVFGVLTTETPEQALERSLADDTNKGHEAAVVAVEMVRLLRSAPVSSPVGSRP
jgi:6,7-dimethyl-8-ribityllumazine synthase